MSLRTILEALRSVPVLPRPAGRRAAFRPWLEPLNGRWVPSFSPAVHCGVGNLPGVRFPEVVGFQKEDVYRTFVVPPATDR